MDGDEEGTIHPQDGPQTAFLASKADIAIYGGAAGGGKTWALLMEPLRHKDVHDFGCVFFRRTTVEIRNEGGLWDESRQALSRRRRYAEGAGPRVAFSLGRLDQLRPPAA